MDRSLRCSLLFRRVVIPAMGLWMFGFVLGALRQVSEADHQPIEVNSVALVGDHRKAPASAPAVSQASIDQALEMFGIRIPRHVAHPTLDRDLLDRGLTVKTLGLGRAEVFIGPSAFQSWGVLGSTLAHEIEVHGRQNFIAISLLDRLGWDGTGEAERRAYLHEIDQRARFQLTAREVQQIRATMHHYYPVGGQAGDPLGTWLAATLLAE